MVCSSQAVVYPKYARFLYILYAEENDMAWASFLVNLGLALDNKGTEYLKAVIYILLSTCMYSIFVF